MFIVQVSKKKDAYMRVNWGNEHQRFKTNSSKYKGYEWLWIIENATRNRLSIKI